MSAGKKVQSPPLVVSTVTTKEKDFIIVSAANPLSLIPSINLILEADGLVFGIRILMKI